MTVSTRIRRLFSRLEEVIGGLLLAAIFVVVLLEVVLRTVFGLSLIWPEEVARVGFVWAVMLGAAAAAREHGLIAIDVVTRRLRPNMQANVAVLSAGIAAAFALVLAYSGVRLVLSFGADRTALTGLPMASFYGALPIGGVLIAYRLLEASRRPPAISSPGDTPSRNGSIPGSERA